MPFVRAFADEMPASAVRLRRDYATVLSLVRAHALLHQATRERDDHGRVVAIGADYERVRETIDALIAEGADQGVAPATRETVEAVARIYAHTSQPVTVRQVDEALGIGKNAAQNRIRRAVGYGWLTDERNHGRGRWLVKPGDSIPDDDGRFLPSIERLRASDRRGPRGLVASDPQTRMVDTDSGGHVEGHAGATSPTSPKGHAQATSGAWPPDLKPANGLRGEGHEATRATPDQGGKNTDDDELDLGTATLGQLRAAFGSE